MTPAYHSLSHHFSDQIAILIRLYPRNIWFQGWEMIKVPAWLAWEPECELQNPLEKKNKTKKTHLGMMVHPCNPDSGYRKTDMAHRHGSPASHPILLGKFQTTERSCLKEKWLVFEERLTQAHT